jgi:TolA-binding protein
VTVTKAITFVFLFSNLLRAQTDSALASHATGKTLLRMGRNALKQNDPHAAVTFFTQYLKAHPKDAQANFLLGRSHMRQRDYDRAQHDFLRAHQLNSAKAPEALYYHALMQKSNGRYDSARFNFHQFRKSYKGKEKALKKLAAREIVFCDSIAGILGIQTKVVVNRLDTTVNSTQQ